MYKAKLINTKSKTKIYTQKTNKTKKKYPNAAI